MKKHVVTSPRYGLESSLTDQAGGGLQKGETPSKEEYKTEKGFLSSCRMKRVRLNAGRIGSESNHKLLLAGRSPYPDFAAREFSLTNQGKSIT